MTERSAPVVSLAPEPPFDTVQVRAVKGHVEAANEQDASFAPFFEFTTRTIHAYVLDCRGQTYPTGKLRRVRGGLSPTHLQLAKAMLSIRDHDTVTLTALGQACGLSPSHFAREFKQSTGLPPHRWALKNKIVRAKEMLLHGSVSLPAIALACGFVDQSHLGRWFKRITGMSPKAWQRRYLDGAPTRQSAVDAS